MTIVLDRKFGGNFGTVGDEPMGADLIGRGPDPDTVWFLHYVLSSGVYRTRPVAPEPDPQPYSGIFIVKAGSPMPSAADDAGSLTLAGIEAFRGDSLPMDCTLSQQADLSYAFTCFLTNRLPVPVLYGQNIRALYSPAFGTATPGPGAGSFFRMTAGIQIVSLKQAAAMGVQV